MKRKDKEIKDKNTIEWILNEAQVCRIALCDNNKPYIVPMNFGIKNKSLFLHSATEGLKIDILNKNNNICFEIDIKNEIIESEKACTWGMKYYSIIGIGKAHFIRDIEEKKKALNIILQKYSKNKIKSFNYPENNLNKTALIKVEIKEITAKKSGF